MTQQYVLFSTGKTPAVITETLFGLWKKKEISGGRIHILTTSVGADALAPLLGEQGAVAHFNRDYHTAWRIPKKWQPTEGGIEVLTDGNKEIGDLRTTRHNNIAADRIAEIIRDWTDQRNVTLHASLAGGRRTMGVFLAQAMSWFARPGDDLYHVTVAPLKEADPKWFYPAPNNEAEQELVDFAAQPFVRMRGLIPIILQTSEDEYGDDTETSEEKNEEKLGFYTKMTVISQMLLEDLVLKNVNLKLDLGENSLTLISSINKNANIKIKLQPSLAAIYLFLFCYANTARKDNPPIRLGSWKPDYRFEEINPCQPFDTVRSYEYRELISKCLNHAKVSAKSKGLTQLYDLLGSELHWNIQGSASERKARSDNLGPQVTKLRTAFRKVLENHAFSFLVQGEFKDKIFVNIDPDRFEVVPEFEP